MSEIDFIKYPKIKQLGDEENKDIFKDKQDIIFLQEKVDGANFRVYITQEGKAIFGSRTQQLTSNDGEDTNVQKNFVRCLKYVRERLQEGDLTKHNGLILFGECMVKHTIDYDWEKTPPFLGFDIFDTKTGKFLDMDEASKIFVSLGLEIVPLIKVLKAGEIKDFTDEDVPKSRYCEGLAEGVVFKNYEKQIYAKYVRAQFKEKNLEEFGGSRKHATTDENYFTAIYCTNARIEKCIWKLIDDGEKLHLSLMPKLIKAVYKDVWEENWNEIVSTRGKTISFDKLKKSFTKRCFHVLNSVITNNALNKEVEE